MTLLALTRDSFAAPTLAANTAALQAGIGAGGSRLIEDGVFGFDQCVGQWATAPLDLSGGGRGVTRLYPTGIYGRCLEFGYPLPGGGARALRRFDMVCQPGQTAIHIQNDTRFRLEEVVVSGGDVGFHLWQAYAARLNGIEAADTRGAGLLLEGRESANGLSLRDAGFFNCGHVLGAPAIDIEGGDGLAISGLNVEGCFAGIRARDTRGVSISGPYIERNAAWPIQTLGACGAWAIDGGWIAGENGHPQTVWRIANMAGMECRGVSFFNIRIEIELATTRDISFPACVFNNANVVQV